MKSRAILFIFFLSVFIAFAGCKIITRTPEMSLDTQKALTLRHIKNDNLFHSKQNITILSLDKNQMKNYFIDIIYSEKNIPTSKMAQEHGALAAINGGFFDRDKGGSVTYFEKNDSVISTMRDENIKWGVPHGLINGALILYKDNHLAIEPLKPDSAYISSKAEKFVLTTGPLLLYDNTKYPLPKLEFVEKRHPRSAICITSDKIKFITVDGRQKDAEGMNLHELQQFLISQSCTEAINLDGGGSTTLWTNKTGVANKPSDKEGEREVSNIIIIKKSSSQVSPGK